MKLYSENEHYKLYEGSMLDMLEVIEPNSIDSIITDPPYELNFMNKGWDNSGIAFQSDTWKKCFEVLKPGGYLLSFGGSRTFHRIACAIEDAGFEIRDTIMWLYGSGFPKSMDIGKALDKKNGVKPIGRKEPTGGITGGHNTGATEKGWHNINNWYEYPECENDWKGWGTALKPSFEPIIVARKPFKGSCVDNIIENGVGGINIDECRVEYEKTTNPATNPLYRQQNADQYKQVQGGELSNGAVSWTSGKNGVNEGGRFPANTILTYDESDFEEVCGGFPISNKPNGNITKKYKMNNQVYGDYGYCNTWDAYQDSGSASRYFYCAKASKKDRDEGLDNFEPSTDKAKGNGLDRVCEFCGVSQLTPELCKCETKSWITKPKKNIHPTVKPTELMQYLVRLVSPKGSTILDCFNGSGSTGKAVMYENKERNADYKYIGIELTPEYLPIAKARIEYVCKDMDIVQEQYDFDDLD